MTERGFFLPYPPLPPEDFSEPVSKVGKVPWCMIGPWQSHPADDDDNVGDQRGWIRIHIMLSRLLIADYATH